MQNLMKSTLRTVYVVVVGFIMVGCGATNGGANKFATTPTPILCEQANAISAIALYYNELMSELNSRSEDCAEYFARNQSISIWQ